MATDKKDSCQTAVPDSPKLYKHGQPFSEVLGWNIKDQVERVRLKKASMIIIDGAVGNGKTTLAVEVADEINRLNGLDPIEIETEHKEAGPQFGMGGMDFLNKLRICYEKKLPCVIYDEGGDFSKRGALTKFNALLNRTFETFRAFKCVVIIALPCFDVLDSQLFDNQIPRTLIHTSDRTENQGDFSVYDLDSMNYIRYYMSKWPKHKPKVYQRVFPNYRGHFLDISPARSRQLDRVSTKNKLDILQESQASIEGLLTYVELARRCSRSVIWVRQKVNELNIKWTKRIKNKVYFDGEVEFQLQECINNGGTDQEA